MAEGDADQVKPEVQTLTRVERIKAGIGKWVENQMPPAVGERYKKTLTVAAERFWGKQPELLAKIQGSIETAAKIAGWADPMIKVAVGAAALYGGVTLLLNPGILTGIGGAAVVLGKHAVEAGTAAAVGAYKFVVDKSVDLGKRVGGVFDRIIHPPIPVGGVPRK